jgi:hypothetical protein
MDFIERSLGFSPDQGNGSYEAFLVIACAALVWLVVHRARAGRGAFRRPW